MLRTFVDNATSWFHAISEFIDDFTMLKFMVQTPITLLCKVTMQNIASRVRAMLALQPIKQKDAEKLDHKLTLKIHKCLGFPFRLNSDILTLPIKLWGFEFPSITKMNIAQTIEGLACDLNHYIDSYRKMACITLADWTCTIHNCINPIDSASERQVSQYGKRLLITWIEAQRGLHLLSLNLCQTDYSFVSKGYQRDKLAYHICRRYAGKEMVGFMGKY